MTDTITATVRIRIGANVRPEVELELPANDAFLNNGAVLGHLLIAAGEQIKSLSPAVTVRIVHPEVETEQEAVIGTFSDRAPAETRKDDAWRDTLGLRS